MIRFIFIFFFVFYLTSCLNRAITGLSKSISKNQNDVESYWRRAGEFYKIKQYKKSLADFDKAIAIDSSFNNGYLFGDRGETKEAMGDLKGAIQDYTIALQFCKTTVPTTPRETFYFYRGRTNLKFGDTASATIDTDSAIYYWNSFPRARYQKGRLEVLRGNYKTAFEYYSDPPTPDFAHDKEFIDDVFYYGLLKFKTGDSTYCDYWKAAAKYKYPKAIEYVSKYCSSK